MPTSSAPSTSRRLLSLLSLLQARRDWPGALLAERLEVSARTVRRDVDRLRELGYPIRATKGPDGGYRLEAGSQLPPLLFDDAQAIALALALRTAVVSGAAVEDDAARALATVRQVMPARLRARLDALEVTAVGRSDDDRDAPADVGTLLAVGAAIRAREELRFDPVGPGQGPGEAGPRRLQPHHLVARGGRWYVVGWQPDATEWRVHRADRIRLRVPNGPRFAPREVPGGDVARFLAARFRGSSGLGESAAAGSWPCHGEAVLHLAARRVAPFVGDGTVEDLGPDRCRVRLGSWSWVGLAAHLTRFDVEVGDVAPAELREAFGLLAARAGRAAQGR